MEPDGVGKKEIATLAAWGEPPIGTRLSPATTRSPHARGWTAAVADPLRKPFLKHAALMDEAEADVLAHLAFPKGHRPQLHSPNPLERRAGAVAIFRNGAAIDWLVGALLLARHPAPPRWSRLHDVCGPQKKIDIAAQGFPPPHGPMPPWANGATER